MKSTCRAPAFVWGTASVVDRAVNRAASRLSAQIARDSTFRIDSWRVPMRDVRSPLPLDDSPREMAGLRYHGLTSLLARVAGDLAFSYGWGVARTNPYLIGISSDAEWCATESAMILVNARGGDAFVATARAVAASKLPWEVEFLAGGHVVTFGQRLQNALQDIIAAWLPEGTRLQPDSLRELSDLVSRATVTEIAAALLRSSRSLVGRALLESRSVSSSAFEEAVTRLDAPQLQVHRLAGINALRNVVSGWHREE